MPKSRRCCIFVIIFDLVTGYVSISGSSGESATLYGGISFNSDNIVFNLYKNDDNYDLLLAMWSKMNSDPVKETYLDGYGNKLSLENGTIRIHNLSKSDEGKYILQPALGTWSMKIEVDLVVLVAPPKQCTPNIKHVKNTLVASVVNEDCGNSTAHVSWYKFCASSRSRSVRKLNNTWELKGKTKSMIVVGKEADTYCACAERSAKHCVRRFDRFDLCSCLKIEKDNNLATLPRRLEMTTWSELSDLTKRTTDIHAERLELPELIKGIIALSIISVLAIVAVIVTSIILYRRWKAPSPARKQELSVETEPVMTTTSSSEAPSPARNQELSVETEPSMTTTSSSEAPSPARNQELSVETEPVMTTTSSSEAPSPARNQEFSVGTEPSMTTTSSSEAPSPSRNQELSERKEISSELYILLNGKIEEPVARIE